MAPAALVSGRVDVVAVIASGLLLSVASCASPVDPGEDGCITPSLDPGITLRSGFAPQTQVRLSPGAKCTLRGDEARAFRLAASDAGAEYLVAVVSSSETPGANASLALRLGGPDVGAARSVRAARISPSVIGVDGGAASDMSSDPELRFRRAARAELERVGALPARAVDRTDSSVKASLGAAVPVLGDRVEFRSSIDANLAVDCARTDVIQAVVRGVGVNFAIAEDVDVAGRLSSSDYGRILDALERFVYPIDTSYFGEPADLDGNGRVWLLLTANVNRATPRGSSTFVAGFFNPTDLADPDGCPASNRGEVLYVLGPDPAGMFSDPVSVADAVANATGVAAHEFEHLLSAQRRIVDGGGDFSDLESTWLGEGLAHTAETVVGLASAGLSPGGNLGFAELAADGAVFTAFHLSNFRRAGFYLSASNRTLALGSDGGSDPGGLSSLEMRGFAWLFVRWLADHAGFPEGGVLGGPAEETLFRDLASGGSRLATGTANVERAASKLLGPTTWRSLLSAYALVPLADDLAGAPERFQLTTFHLRDVFAGLNTALPERTPFQRPFPLEADEIRLDGALAEQVTFDLRASAASYFILRADGPHPAVDIGIATQGGAMVPGSVRLDVVILRIS